MRAIEMDRKTDGGSSPQIHTYHTRRRPCASRSCVGPAWRPWSPRSCTPHTVASPATTILNLLTRFMFLEHMFMLCMTFAV